MKLVILRGGMLPAGRRAASRDPAPTGRHGVAALSDDAEGWALINVAPNVAEQLQTDPALRCHSGLMDADTRSIILTDAQIDHVTGLLSLRDGAPIDLYATPAVFEVLSQQMPVLQVLQRYCGVHWHVIPVAGETLSASFRVEALPTLEFTALSTESQAALCALEPGTPTSTGLSVAIAVRDVMSDQRLFVSQGAQVLGGTELDWLRRADCVMLDDHTHWLDEEAQPSVPAWRAQRKVMLRGQRPEELHRASTDGFEVAYDGMVIDL